MIGQRLGSFHLDSKIGSGAMGEVFRASQVLKDGRTRTAAVKVVSADFLERENALKRFQLEAEILAQLRHPHIVRYYAHGKSQGIFYYAMEFVRGETLDALLERREFLPWREVVDLGIQLGHALQYAHEHQVVHRDLKPSNLMVAPDGTLKLTDFGIAKDLDATEALTRTGRTLGTAAYMAPEQIRGTPGISHKTDLYALGCLLYQMLTGHPPFEGKSAVVMMHAHMAEPAPRPSGRTPDVPRALDDLVVRLMAKDPPERPWDAAQVAHQLEELRDRAKRGERIPMAFDRGRDRVAAEGGTLLPGSDGEVNPARMTGSGRPRKAAGSKKKRAAAEGAADGLSLTRRHVETAGLGLALAALLGVAAYALWPASMRSLHADAEKLMASDRRVDWKIALRDYVEPIERRFPEHPYAEQFGSWRDRIALDEARSRSKQLESPVASISRPHNDAETIYQDAITAVAPLVTLEQHALIAERWRGVIDQLDRRGDPDERGWLLLAEQRHAEELRALELQRRSAASLVQRAAAAVEAGRPEAARPVLQQIRQEFAAPALGDPQGLGMAIDRAATLLGELDRPPESGADDPIGDLDNADAP